MVQMQKNIGQIPIIKTFSFSILHYSISNDTKLGNLISKNEVKNAPQIRQQRI